MRTALTRRNAAVYFVRPLMHSAFVLTAFTPKDMNACLRKGRTGRRLVSAVIVLGFLPLIFACGSGRPSQVHTTPPPEVPLTRLSTDTFTNGSSQHATEVEPDTFAFGSTIVSAFQVGRIFSGGAADIGFATSTDGGATWTNGFLPGITMFQGGTFSAASDPSVAFDAAHGVWMIASLPLGISNEVAVSRSPDGLNWGNPIKVSNTTDVDKNWVACDNAAASPFFGHCYVQWDDPSASGLIWMSTSTDGGLTWAPGLNTADLAAGISGQPVVQPNGTVVVPFESWSGANMLAFTSTDGGASWNTTVAISTITDHLVAGGLRTSPLPSAEVDGAGTVYVVWQDCRFRSGCTSNDLVMGTSTDGNTWTSVTRIPIDAVSSSVDHFIPGLGVDPATSGSSAHLGLTYYSYSQTNCSFSNCALNVGFVSSQDGGSTWSAPQLLAGPMSLAWLPDTFAGPMVADYISTSYSGGKAYGVFAVARSNSGTVFDEAIFTNTAGFRARDNQGVFSSSGELPVADAKSDHPPRQFYDLEHRYPVWPPN
jgi:hypothetical protein